MAGLFSPKDLKRFERLASQFKLQIKSKMLLYKKWATGRTWASLTPYAYETATSLEVGLSSTSPIAVAVQETGRVPGSIPYGFDTILYDWSIAKGIGFSSATARMKFARALAWKISRDGTEQFRRGTNTDIFTDARPTYEKVVVDQVIKSVSSMVILRTRFL